MVVFVPEGNIVQRRDRPQNANKDQHTKRKGESERKQSAGSVTQWSKYSRPFLIWAMVFW